MTFSEQADFRVNQIACKICVGEINTDYLKGLDI